MDYSWQYARRRKHISVKRPYRFRWILIDGVYRPKTMMPGDVVKLPSGRLGLYASLYGYGYVLLSERTEAKLKVSLEDEKIAKHIQYCGITLKEGVNLAVVDEKLPFARCSSHLNSEIKDAFAIYKARWKQ